jgi:hypothetical protein
MDKANYLKIAKTYRMTTNAFYLLSIIVLGLFVFSCEKADEENVLSKEGYIEYEKTTDNSDNVVYFQFAAQEVIIDWGDGTKENYVSSKGEMKEYQHEYQEEGVQTIKINTKKLTYFEIIHENWIIDDTGVTIMDVEGKSDKLRLGNCPDLTEIHCSVIGLSVLEIGKAQSLTLLDCPVNNLTSLNLNACPALEQLYCMHNYLSSLEISQCKALKDLWCLDNRLTELDLQENKELVMLMCGKNQISDLDVSNHKLLSRIVCNYIFYVLENGGGYTLYTDGWMYRSIENRSESVGMRSSAAINDDGITAIKGPSESLHPPLTRLNLNGCNSLISISCNSNQLVEISIRDCNSLQYLKCKYNELTANELNSIFDSLPANVSNAEISITGNSGASGCNETIATGKGWKVIN